MDREKKNKEEEEEPKALRPDWLISTDPYVIILDRVMRIPIQEFVDQVLPLLMVKGTTIIRISRL